jgi:hypothetical protein
MPEEDQTRNEIVTDASQLEEAEMDDGAEADAPEPNEPVDEPADDEDEDA